MLVPSLSALLAFGSLFRLCTRLSPATSTLALLPCSTRELPPCSFGSLTALSWVGHGWPPTGSQRASHGMVQIIYTCNDLSRGDMASSQLKLCLACSLPPRPTNISRSQARRRVPLSPPTHLLTQLAQICHFRLGMSLTHTDYTISSIEHANMGITH